MTQTAKSIDVIIPTFNAGTQLNNLINSLKQQNYKGKISVIVVDSGSTDDTIDSLNNIEGIDLQIICIAKENFSHSYARNLGAEKSQADILLFMTQDAVPENDSWISRMTEPLEREFAAVSCAEDTSGCSDLFYLNASRAYQKYIGIYNKDKDCQYLEGMTTEEIRVNSALNNVACCIKADLFNKYKFHGEYGEDLDLGKRLIQDGYKLKLLGTVHVKHFHDRRAYYHMKRQFAENKAINEILGINETQISTEQISWLICQSYLGIIEASKVFKRKPVSQMELWVFRQSLRVFERKK
ncbi:MAG: glycosyltransferase, partial [Butyrivibrio sp.]|nr:glycosyltransferase [Butyrivibrio sp.]